MAAPANKTNKDLNGKWLMNRTLSDSADAGFVLQGIGYLTRTAIGFATVTIDVSQYDAPPKAPSTAEGTFVHIDIEQSASGLTSTKELRCLDDVPRNHSDWIFGAVQGQSRWVALDDVDDEYLKTGWDAVEGKGLILSHVVSQGNGWTATQVWGFQTVHGERRYCRNILVQNGGERAEFRLVYDFLE
ncbi:Uncharacterized protein TCAP_00755 [Tolypocladium capitatum]|uniref:LCCL domain-containing protein n=1 Tax=Tolypocladium capitatum TaxID=45235 RepID=A0A2K3QP79_9HYPO|nr:Uncharacterized protein TCAP_00755 [Tolypocladium capitatum]